MAASIRVQPTFSVPRTVLFDFDGVIIDSESASFRAWTEVFRRQGVVLQLTDWLPFVGRATPPSPAQFLEEKTGKRHANAQAEKDAIYKEITRTLPSRPGVEATLRALHRSSVTLIVVSNSRESEIAGHLIRLRLRSLFAGIVGGFESGRTSKQRLYSLAMEQFRIDRESALAVEDSEHGARSALAVGLSVVGFPNAITTHQRLDTICGIIPFPSELTTAAVINAFHSR
jgi:HAD superfamily hydrolase (TIGR01509 family)